MAGIFGNEQWNAALGSDPSEEELWRAWAHSMLYPSSAQELANGVIERPSGELRNALNREFRVSYENHLNVLRTQLAAAKREIERLSALVDPAISAVVALENITRDLAGCEELPQERLVELRDQAKQAYEAGSAIGVEAEAHYDLNYVYPYPGV